MKKFIKKGFVYICIAALAFSLIMGGCSAGDETTSPAESPSVTATQASSAQTTAAAPATRIVMDKDGNAIELPYNVEKVAPQIGAMAHMTALMGYADRIVAAADHNLSDYFKKIFPEYVKANPRGLSTNNVEDVIASGAQVLYGPITDEATIAKYKAAGIAVVPLNTFSTVEQMKDNIRKIAEILGDDAPVKAEDFCRYYDKQLAYVQQKTAGMTDDQRVKILSLSYNAGALNTINSRDICSVYMATAGGINVAGDLSVVTGISTEDIIRWNPEIIITFDATSKSKILAEATLKTVPAIKNGNVFIVPYGTYLWSVRSAEGAMMPLWLAKMMHPGLFTELDMDKVVSEYYKHFYNYEIPDEEIKTILNGRQT